MIKTAEFRLNKYNSFLINLTAFTIFILGFALLLKLTGIEVWLEYISNSFYNRQIFLIVTTLSGVVVLHELLHGLAYSIFGAKLKFGLKLLNLYTMDVSGTLYTTWQIAVIMLFPLFVLTGILLTVGLLFDNLLLLMLLGTLYNVCGSTGDILLLAFILYKGRKCLIKDEEYGFGLYT